MFTRDHFLYLCDLYITNLYSIGVRWSSSSAFAIDHPLASDTTRCDTLDVLQSYSNDFLSIVSNVVSLSVCSGQFRSLLFNWTSLSTWMPQIALWSVDIERCSYHLYNESSFPQASSSWTSADLSDWPASTVDDAASTNEEILCLKSVSSLSSSSGSVMTKRKTNCSI